MRTLGEIKPGQTIGRYEFLIPIAEGGMASVWAARLKGSRGFQKTLAIKMMLSSLSENPQFEEMFLDEARLAAAIRHPNVVEIFDLGEESEVLYIVMEWVDGEPLSTVFRTAKKRDGIPIGVAVRIVADACAGLNAAHELKDDDGKLVEVVHRDISPQNILVTYDGNVKLVDFGVAKAAGREADKTSAGTVKGKAPYMSPEQALGKDIDRRTDIFAMGIVLYQLTTQKHPFRGESDLITLRNIIDKPCPPPSSIVPGFPRPLEAVILKSLDKNPAKRFQTAAEFEAALDRVMPPTAPRVRAADVSRFVRDLVGERGEKRRDALKSAVRLADERLQNDAEAARLTVRPIAEIGLTGQIGVLTGVRSDLIPTMMGADGVPLSQPPQSISILPVGGNGPGSSPPITSSHPSITSVASPAVAHSKPPTAGGEAVSKRSKMPFVLAAGVVALVIGGVVFSTTRNRRMNTSSQASQPTVTAPVEPAKTAPSASETAKVVAKVDPVPSASVAEKSDTPSISLTSLPKANEPTGAKVAVKGNTVPHGNNTPQPKATTDKKVPGPKSGGFVPPKITSSGID
jgi:eukaryotic-like serine/threonine-protein kinase